MYHPTPALKRSFLIFMILLPAYCQTAKGADLLKCLFCCCETTNRMTPSVATSVRLGSIAARSEDPIVSAPSTALPATNAPSSQPAHTTMKPTRQAPPPPVLPHASSTREFIIPPASSSGRLGEQQSS